MKLPRSLRIGSLTYKVRSDATAVAALDANDSGSCDCHNSTITINPTRPCDVQLDTLVHEILHAITDQVGLREQLGDKLEEQVVLRITSPLVDTIRRNKALRDLICCTEES